MYTYIKLDVRFAQYCNVDGRFAKYMYICMHLEIELQAVLILFVDLDHLSRAF